MFNSFVPWAIHGQFCNQIEENNVTGTGAIVLRKSICPGWYGDSLLPLWQLVSEKRSLFSWKWKGPWYLCWEMDFLEILNANIEKRSIFQSSCRGHSASDQRVPRAQGSSNPPYLTITWPAGTPTLTHRLPPDKRQQLPARRKSLKQNGQ